MLHSTECMVLIPQGRSLSSGVTVGVALNNNMWISMLKDQLAKNRDDPTKTVRHLPRAMEGCCYNRWRYV